MIHAERARLLRAVAKRYETKCLGCATALCPRPDFKSMRPLCDGKPIHPWLQRCPSLWPDQSPEDCTPAGDGDPGDGVCNSTGFVVGIRREDGTVERPHLEDYFKVLMDQRWVEDTEIAKLVMSYLDGDVDAMLLVVARALGVEMKDGFG